MLVRLPWWARIRVFIFGRFLAQSFSCDVGESPGIRMESEMNTAEESFVVFAKFGTQKFIFRGSVQFFIMRSIIFCTDFFVMP